MSVTDSFNSKTNTLNTNVNVAGTAYPSIPLETTSSGTTTLISEITLPSPSAISDVSDVSGVGQLPIRAEKRILPSNVSLPNINDLFILGAAGQGASMPKAVTTSDFYLKKAHKDLSQSIKIRIPHRGFDPVTKGVDTNNHAEFTFLINPKTVAVNKQTVDTQAMTRGGWQFGVWGEDITTIRIAGQSAGSYFTLGLTDEYKYFSRSYRNILQLQQVFENNGYWFEGEEYNEGPLAADYLRRRIRMHQDVEFHVGNYIWYGMFDSMNVQQDSSTPFRIEFDMTFIAWKERYRDSSGYWNSKLNNIQRGHSYPNVEGQTANISTSNALAQSSSISNATKSSQMASQTSPNAISPASLSAMADDTLPTGNPQVRGTVGPIGDLLNNPSNQPIWIT